MPESTQTETVSQVESEIPMLRRYARFLARDVELADDLVQECLARAIARIDSFEPGTNLQGWLIVILRNVFFNECRRAKRERLSLKELGTAAPRELPAQQEDSLMLSELERAFMSLSPDHREILSLIVIEGMTYEQTAEVLGVTMGTIKSRLSRARGSLSALMDYGVPRPYERSKTVADAL
ncbi:sigma-70 family RNA polymerase sigma factor [Methyloceanibacter caenitepidi]|uniref:RNA polymerase sigma-E factor n=1 Tax=Methyloceanibacter caenitepidi TaxID=1384459 RepID=A0A0A8K288_9HYPH|nr:sigma-70 family RNA polymerase sigma factor [Methyloceanibacter caenitepidi]BAQ16861.1 RNA polymerase sigma-E factor [Methyloceanibacter caenitepidi]